MPDLIRRRESDLKRGELALLSLLDIARVRPEDFQDSGQHERLIRELENAGNVTSDEAFGYWPQNKELEVQLKVQGLVAEREWLSVFLLPAYSPDLNPVEWVWAHVKRSLANLAVMALDRLETLVRNRLKRLQYRPHTLDGFIAGTGLTLDNPASP
ncbi:transposase [Streptomyces microflavus]|uniref:transposase n=1 Tax=Streptomyces microflavus TaxID=1919 RepID=UPI003800E921